MSTAYLPTSIDRTGVTDVTAPLNAWLASLPPNTTAQLAGGIKLRVEGGALLDGKQSLKLRSSATNPATIFKTTPGTTGVIKVNGGSNVTLENLIFNGGHKGAGIEETAYVQANEGKHNIAAYGVQGLNLLNVSSYDSHADFFYMGRLKIGPALGGAASYRWCSKVRLVGGDYLRGGRQAFTPSAAYDVDLTPRTVGLVPRHIIDIEPNLAAFNGARGIRFHDADVLEARLGLMALAGCGPVDDVALRNLQCDTPLDVWAQEGKDSPPNGPRRKGFSMADCVSSASSGNSLGGTSRFDKWDGITMRGNRQPMDPLRNMALAVVTPNCTGIDIDGNDIPGGTNQYVVKESI